MHSSVKIFNNVIIHISNDNPHNKLQNKILLDIITCKQCIHENNSILINIHYSGEIHLHVTGECLFIGIAVQVLCTPGDCTCMHAVKKGRRLENKIEMV